MPSEPFDSWAIVELMGHVKMAGRLTEEERFGSKLGRLDVPRGEDFGTIFFNAASVYRITACTEEVARAVAARNQPEPIHQWEMPRQLERPDVPIRDDDDDDYDPDADPAFESRHRDH
jgi:hypothetical protein